MEVELEKIKKYLNKNESIQYIIEAKLIPVKKKVTRTTADNSLVSKKKQVLITITETRLIIYEYITNKQVYMKFTIDKKEILKKIKHYRGLKGKITLHLQAGYTCKIVIRKIQMDEFLQHLD